MDGNTGSGNFYKWTDEDVGQLILKRTQCGHLFSGRRNAAQQGWCTACVSALLTSCSGPLWFARFKVSESRRLSLCGAGLFLSRKEDQSKKMFLHIFAVLLLCDYGMFSTPSPSSTERSTIETANTSDLNTTVTTAESSGGSEGLGSEADEELSGLNSTTTSYENTTETDSWTDSSTVTLPSRPESSTLKPYVEGKKVDSVDSSVSEDPKNSGSITGGVIILILILILIFLLLGVLYFLRKKGRSYSFDLTRADGPANDYARSPLRSDQQGISYEPTNKDLPVSLDYEHEDKPEEKSSPKANGCAGEKTEQTSANGNEQENVPEENSFSSNSSLTPPMKKVEFNLDLDLIGGESDLNDLTTADDTDAPQNENNNNVSNAGRGSAGEIFTEISLDEPKHHA